MKLPDNTSELTELFRNAATPDISEFRGEYLVDMLTVFPSFKRFSHIKVFYLKNGRVLGHNVLFNRTWGHFLLEEGICNSPHPVRTAVINYDRDENTFPIRRIRDHVRRVDNDIYLGRFNYLFHERLYFLGYFSLERK